VSRMAEVPDPYFGSFGGLQPQTDAERLFRSLA